MIKYDIYDVENQEDSNMCAVRKSTVKDFRSPYPKYKDPVVVVII